MGGFPSVVADIIMSTTTTKAVVIGISAIVKRAGCYEARLGDGRVLVTASKQPFVDAARRLIDLGYVPTTVLVMRHAGSDTDCLTAQIGAAAKLRVKEDRGRLRSVPWEPIPRRVKAVARAKAKRVDRVVPAHANEPSPRPGAVVADQFPSVPVPTPSRPVKPTDRTAAERQRRYRERKRNGETATYNAHPVTSSG